MEEYDELSSGPNASGVLDLSHGAWATIPSELYAYAPRLLTLHMQNNEISDVGDDFAQLYMLSHLNLERNSISSLTLNIGACVRLRDLNLGFNKLTSVPASLSKCVLLEKLCLNNNSIASIPEELGDIFALKILDLRFNQLESLPTSLARIPTLEAVDCAGNPRLQMVPDDMRDSSTMVIWVLRLFEEQEAREGKKEEAYRAVDRRAMDFLEEEMRLKDDLATIKQSVADLTEARPVRWIAFKKKVIEKSAGKCSIM